MCGITGILVKNTDGQDPSKQKQVLKGMISTLMHRGPDAWGYYLSSQAALGHTRLSILDLDSAHQPMATERYIIAYNGEVFNYIELREELIANGVQFQTTGDTEVVLKCFEYYGIGQALKKFNGQFALLLWDKKFHKLYAARDRYGIRPLYRLTFGSQFYFASEMKAFDTIPGFQRTIDPQRLYQHALLWNTLGDSTVYKDIRSLPPGTYEEYTPGSGAVKQQRYYEIGESHQPDLRSFDEAMASFTSLLEDAVRLRLRSDVPVAAYLSGGIDSSVISHLVANVTRKRFGTFSVSFSDPQFDESEYQQQMVDRLGSSHIMERIDYKDIGDNFFNTVYHIERPVFRTAAVPLYLLSKKVNEDGIKVVVTGEGADEILFGYDSFKEIKLLEFWARQPESKLRPQLIRRLYPHLLLFNDPKQFAPIKMYYKNFLQNHTNPLNAINIRCYNNRVIGTFIHKAHRIDNRPEILLDDLACVLPQNYASWSLLQRTQFMEMKTLLSGYLLSSQGDRVSMAHSVEGRYPFLDHRLVDFVFSLPDKYKLNLFSQKHLLRKAFEKDIPAAIIDRPKRPYQSPDLKSFFINGKLDDQAAYYLSDEMVEAFGLFDKNMVGRFLKKFKSGLPEEVSYRDNMVLTFLLSTQMASQWAKQPCKTPLRENKKRVAIIDL